MDCLEPFSFGPWAGVPDSVKIDVSTWTLLEDGDRGTAGTSPAAASDALLRGGIIVRRYHWHKRRTPGQDSGAEELSQILAYEGS